MHDPISYFEALILGIIQGLTEFLPISSSAHIPIVSTLAGWGRPRAPRSPLSPNWARKQPCSSTSAGTSGGSSPPGRGRCTPRNYANIDARMGWYVIVGTIPIGFFGYTFSDQIETAARNLYLVATVLIVFGLVLGAADRWGKQDKTLDDFTIKTGLIYGFGQALALIPGVSRSGATISTGRILGFDRPSATRYAFLLAIPAVVISGLYEALKIGDEKNVPWGPTILATVVAFFVGYAVISWLIRYVSHGSFLPFVIHRIARAHAGTGAAWAQGSSPPSPRRLQPAGLPERPVQPEAHPAHERQDQQVAVFPVQFRHVVEVHAVDPGDHRGHRGDRHPGTDPAHVRVLLQVLP